MRVGDIVVVSWLDARGPADLDVGETLDIGRAHTVGQVHEITEEKLCVAAEWFDDGSHRDATAIPRISIVNVEVLREG